MFKLCISFALSSYLLARFADAALQWCSCTGLAWKSGKADLTFHPDIDKTVQGCLASLSTSVQYGLQFKPIYFVVDATMR